MPARAVGPHSFETALALKGRRGLPTRMALKHRPGAEMPLRAASPHGFEVALALKWCGLPARTAFKQAWRLNEGAGCRPARLRSSPGAQMPRRAASPHGFEAALALKCRCGLLARTTLKQPCELPARTLALKCNCGLPARTVLKQPWCSKAGAGCQPARL